MDRLDWSFKAPEGAVNALLGRDDVRQAPDGRYQFRFCPGAAVTAWSEMALPAPSVAQVPTLIVRTEASLAGLGVEQRYRDELGAGLTVVTVPTGHNVLWESPAETIAAVAGFLQGRGQGPPRCPGGAGSGLLREFGSVPSVGLSGWKPAREHATGCLGHLSRLKSLGSEGLVSGDAFAP